ncbi:MAG: PstS family phosphate ABC transporter substrate-binding protein [Methanomassiliicoccales archaeon]|jgi:phosphate transport system substrate-binding protein|nr:PstS family phosphate ABC transporter substrate-binding protein [Methanomassiliicoccales archaeon]
MEKKTMMIAVGVVAVILIAAVAGVLLMNDGGSGAPQKTTIKQKGSDTMLELASAWAEEFGDEEDNYTVEVSGGGSGTGITALIAKQVDVAQASRAMKSSEVDQALAAGVNPVEFKVAIDGIAIITHQSNTVAQLTTEQLRGLFNGTITNWNQVGGPDRNVALYGRQSTSGTYAYFQEHVLKNGAYAPGMNQMTGNAAIVQAVQLNDGAIGYVGIGYVTGATGIDILNVQKDSSSPAYSPLNESAVLQNKYDLARYLYLYTDGNPQGAIKMWIEWVLTEDKGQAVAADIGFYALPWYDIEEGMAKLGEVDTQDVAQKGSDTMLELCSIWAEEFHDSRSWINVEISGGGSGTGITALIAKQVDVAQASRAMKSSELAQAQAAGLNPVEFKVAVDGIAIITHQSNTVGNLTIAQLRGIYNGTITNWDQVGGPDRAIALYGRQSTSGTYAYFQEHVLLNGAYSAGMNQMTGNAAIVQAVQLNEGGIGYVGIGYVESATGIDILDIRKDAASPAYSPLDKEAVLSGQYNIARYLYLYTADVPEGAVWQWLNWILDANKGQKVAEEIGFYALPSDVLEQQRAKLF